MLPRGDLFRRLGLWTTLALAAGGCSGDLFHTTDWVPTCTSFDCAPGAANGAGGGGAGGADAATGSGGAGLPVAGSGGGPTPGAGGAASGGAGGGGAMQGAGGGACSTCNEVGQVVLNGSPSPSPSTLCPGAAQDAWDAVFECICQSGCAGSCDDSACLLQQASDACVQCAGSNCLGPLEACQSN